ncbi:MAG: hypothetical protein GPW18_05985 [Euryarchaeota archaeon]|nr:hypothetical protein [Euryarchaeota archaeon]
MEIGNKEELVSYLENEIKKLERKLNYYRNLLDVIQKAPKEKEINDFSKAIFLKKKIFIIIKKQVLKEEELKKMLNYYDVKIDGMKIVTKDGFVKEIIMNADPVAFVKIKSLIREILREVATQ